MATLTWTAGTSGLWTTAANWSPAQVPALGDSVLVTQPGAYLITLPANVQIGSLTLNDAQAVISTAGSLQVDNGLALTAGTLQINGTLNATNLSNSGTLINNGSVTLNGTLNASALQNIGGTNGILNVTGQVLNTAGTLDGTGLQSQFVVIGLGTIDGGTVVNLKTPGSVTLNGVTWRGELSPADLIVTNGVVLTGANGSGPGTLSPDANILQQFTVEFTNTQTFDNAIVNRFGTFAALANRNISGLPAVTLTVGSNVTFNEISSFENSVRAFEFDGDTILNHGTVLGHSRETTSIPEQNDGLLAFRSSDFENFGLIDAADSSAPVSNPPIGIAHNREGIMNVSITGARFVNHAGGVIEIGQSAGVASLAVAATTDFTNDGTLLTLDTAPSSVQGGTIDIAALLAGSGTIGISGNGSVTLEGAAAATQSIDFTGQGVLMLTQPQFVASVINGFDVGDIINLGVAASAVSYTSGDLRMQVNGDGTFDLAVTGTHSLADFVVNSSGSATSITLACFAAGTRLATTRGMIAVEALQPGEAIRLADRDGSLPIAWIGHREVDCRRHPAPHEVRPVRIAAGAFARGVPRRDLYLSPDHAVFVRDVLIPVKYLVNGTTITQVPVDRIRYFHVELPRHAVLSAEGLSVESLLPGSDHSGFANGGGVVALHPAWAWEGEGCAPLVVTGPDVAAVRARLDRRAKRQPRALAV